jgi:hypothetical protein
MTYPDDKYFVPEKWPSHVDKAVRSAHRVGLTDALFDMIVYATWKTYVSEDDPRNYPTEYYYDQVAQALREKVIARIEGHIEHWSKKN